MAKHQQKESNSTELKKYKKAVENIFDALLKKNRNGIDSLTKAEILMIMGEKLKEHYWHIVSALEASGRVRKVRRRTGGIDVSRGQGIPFGEELKRANWDKIEKYLRVCGILDRRAKVSEKEIWDPFAALLEESNLYQIVDNRKSRLSGGKWENADILAITYHTLEFHAGIFPTVTSFEVKRQFPSVTDVQQAASYLRYSHESYLAFFEETYRGKDPSELDERLKDENISDFATTFGIGLIVIFRPQQKSKNYQYQILKEAPRNSISPQSVELGIRNHLDQEKQDELKRKLRQQLKKVLD